MEIYCRRSVSFPVISIGPISPNILHLHVLWSNRKFFMKHKSKSLEQVKKAFGTSDAQVIKTLTDHSAFSCKGPWKTVRPT